MTRCATLAAIGTLGFLAVAVPTPVLGDPGHGQPVTVERTVTRTVTASLNGHSIGYVEWRRRQAVAWVRQGKRRESLLADRLRHASLASRRRWAPTVTYAIRLASAVYGVSESKMRAVAYCESTMNPYATNGRYRGLFQLGWSPFGFSPYDPVASALSTAQTVVRDGSWRQWACG